jgi:hypothetical protein
MPADLIVPAHFTTQFDTNWRSLAEQKVSRLRSRGLVDTGCTGERRTHNQVGSVTAEETTGERYKKIVLTDLPTSLRSVFPRQFQTPTGESRWDERGLLPTVSPRGKHTMAHAAAFGRRCDEVFINALGGDAQSGPNGTTAVPLPAAQKIAFDFVPSGTAAASSLTVPKLLQAISMLEEAEAYGQDQMENGIRLSIAASSKMLKALRLDANSTGGSRMFSKDILPPVLDERGHIKEFLGLDFVRTELLDRDPADATVQFAYIWTTDAIQFDVWEEMSVTIDRRPDLSNAVQFLSQFSVGAGRLEEVKVIQIACRVA